jgi:hypothetical protein
MRQARAAGLTPGERPPNEGNSQEGNGEGAPVNVEAKPLGELPDLKRMKAEDWAKLPPKVAQELLENSRESMSPEFREQISHYFRIIAERARKNNAAPKAPRK